MRWSRWAIPCLGSAAGAESTTVGLESPEGEEGTEICRDPCSAQPASAHCAFELLNGGLAPEPLGAVSLGRI